VTQNFGHKKSLAFARLKNKIQKTKNPDETLRFVGILISTFGLNFEVGDTGFEPVTPCL